MIDALGRKSASPAIAALRRYVTDYVNRHDFSVIREFMTEDYTLHTGGALVSGRDGPYKAAVAQQLEQFPGLIFTAHELVHCGDRIGIRFTEHGASTRHDGRCAAWPSIAIYGLRDGRLARCAIEQDYFSRRRQLDCGVAIPVDRPALAPWDTRQSAPNPVAEQLVSAWLRDCGFLHASGVQVDDSNATGTKARIIDSPDLSVTEMLSGGETVAFHAVQTGVLTDDFGGDVSPVPGQPVSLHLSGLVTVHGDRVVRGNVIRDRWGLYRRLTKQKAA